ncbi:hypothetical protein CSOJ01_15097, partial [Colletotrichum sojae]
MRTAAVIICSLLAASSTAAPAAQKEDTIKRGIDVTIDGKPVHLEGAYVRDSDLDRLGWHKADHGGLETREVDVDGVATRAGWSYIKARGEEKREVDVDGVATRAVITVISSLVESIGPADPNDVPLRRAAHEAEIKHVKTLRDREQRKERRPCIDFGCPVPFTNIPGLILSGFGEAKAVFSKDGSDSKVLEHYQLAMNCLSNNIDDPLCCLMLMITLTVCSSSETPEVAPGSRKFGTAAKRKDPAQLALVMVTRMMWFLYPGSFPWDKGSGGTAHDVAEMTKKIEHKGCSNRTLRELGW